MLHPVATRSNYHHADGKAAEVLLELDALIRREKNRESIRCGTPQEHTVLETAPALLLNGAALVGRQMANELPR
jgi:hypothetical protein